VFIAHPSPVPPVVMPKIVLVESTAPIRRHPTHCQIADWAPPPAGATLVVAEWAGVAVRRKPKTLRLRPGPIVECFGGGGAVVDLGRYVVYAMVGRRAPPAAVAEVRRAFAALRLRR
jgi:hypothetical protein